MIEQTEQRTALLDALEELRAGIGLERLRVCIEVHPGYYPEAQGREVADLICRLIAQHLWIERVDHHELPTCREAVAEGHGDRLTSRVIVFYGDEEGGA